MKRYGVIGLGSFGYYVAKSLYEENKEVIAVDIDKDKVQAVAPFSTDAVVLDATDKEKLRALGLDAMDAVVVSTGHKISVSILVTILRKSASNVSCARPKMTTTAKF